MPGPLAYGVFLTEYRDVFRLAAPDLLTRPVLGILGAIGRLRGYKPNPYGSNRVILPHLTGRAVARPRMIGVPSDHTC